MNNDLISRSALNNFVEFDAKVIAPYKHTAADILAMIVTAPAVDAVEVVRCEKCIHQEFVDMGDDIGAISGCALWERAMPLNGFCSFGERRTDGT